jgi:hypothetical protein
MGFACNGLCISVEPHAKQEWRESVWRGLARTAQAKRSQLPRIARA